MDGDAGCRMRDAGCGMQDAGCGMRDILHLASQISFSTSSVRSQNFFTEGI